MGLDPAKDLAIRSLATNIGNEEILEDIFGVPALSTYGFHEVQFVAAECPARQGLHVFEDAFDVDVVDVDTGAPLPDGETGALVVTEMYKTGSAQFRYNIMDLSFRYPRERCECGSWLRRIGKFAGRGDNMVKLRGVNVWPEGVRSHRHRRARRPARVLRDGATPGRPRRADSVAVESDVPEADRSALAAQIERALQDALGVRLGVEVVARQARWKATPRR